MQNLFRNFTKNIIRVIVLALFCSQIGSQAFAASTNLIPNPSFETASSDPTLPLNWFKGGWGNNNRVLTYPVAGIDGAKAVKIDITQYTDGDAKWYHQDVPVTAGKIYAYADWYMANVPSFVTVRYLMTDGSYTYVDVTQAVTSSTWKNLQTNFVVPNGAVSATMFHSIQQVGSLTVDNVSLSLQTTTPPPSPPQNVINNPSVETPSTTSPTLPAGWKTGRWGTNTSTFTYPATGLVGSRAIRVDVTAYASGDAKWYFDDVSVTPGTTYTFSDTYQSSSSSEVTARFTLTDGTFQYLTLGVLPAANSATNFSKNFVAPAAAISVTVFHCLTGVGSLTTDNFSLLAPQPVALWGAYPGNQLGDAATFETQIGHTMNLQSTFEAWTDPFPTEYGPTVRDKGKTFVVFWEQTGEPLDDIIAGRADATINQFAAGAKAYAGPVILAPLHEMNGNWNSWSGTVGTNTPAKVISAWRHIHDLFSGATNVKFAWTVNSNSVPDTAANAITAYYPGDAYTDYVAIDGFNNGLPWLTFDQIFSQPLQTLAQYKKPIYILSMASAPGSLKPDWITDALTVQMPRHPEVVGWVWFNQIKTYNWRVDSDSASLTAFKAALPN